MAQNTLKHHTIGWIGTPRNAVIRSLGDLSHNVYVPVNPTDTPELLILDRWTSVQGLGQFSTRRP